jgi:hypothetical protein
MIRIGGYLIDAAISERESLESEVTEYPVESGAVITDHVRNRPLMLDMEFVVSDTPIGEAAAARADGVVPSSEARQKLKALRATRQPFTVVSGAGTYENMVFTSLEFPRDGSTGDALKGTATLQQLDIAEVRRLSVATGGTSLGRRAGLGRRPATTVEGAGLWLCPTGVAVSKDAATNQRAGCRLVTTRDAGFLFGPQLADAKTGEFLSQDERKGMVVNISAPRKKNYAFDETKRQWVNRETGRPIAKETVVPADDFEIPEKFLGRPVNSQGGT